MASIGESMKLGNCVLSHRVIMAPMTRLRADDDHIPQQMVHDFYRQRASVPGTLLITEACFIAANARGRDENAPGIFSKAQIGAWRRITEDIHKKGSYVFMQLWHVGRAARQRALEKAGLESLSSSNVRISSDFPRPRPMAEEEIWETIDSFAQAARNAIEAGCDGVEIHGANGYLIDQFNQDVCNKRTDKWGGSVENRARFCLEVVGAVTRAIGPGRTAVRLSPFSDFQAMGMRDPIPQFSHLARQLRGFGLAYLHLIEPRVSGNVDRKGGSAESLDFILDIWKGSGPIVLAGGYTRHKAEGVLAMNADNRQIAFAFGRHFISNPDLPYRLLNNVELAPYRRELFYEVGSSQGYTDYSFSREWDESQAATQ